MPMVPPVWMIRTCLFILGVYLSVVWAKTGLVVACGHLDLLVELEFSQDLLVLLLLVFPLPRH